METYLYKFLKKKCEEKGFVYGRLEDKADLSHSVVQAIRNGRTQLKPATKQKLAQALAVPSETSRTPSAGRTRCWKTGKWYGRRCTTSRYRIPNRSRTARMTTRWKNRILPRLTSLG